MKISSIINQGLIITCAVLHVAQASSPVDDDDRAFEEFHLKLRAPAPEFASPRAFIDSPKSVKEVLSKSNSSFSSRSSSTSSSKVSSTSSSQVYGGSGDEYYSPIKVSPQRKSISSVDYISSQPLPRSIEDISVVANDYDVFVRHAVSPSQTPSLGSSATTSSTSQKLPEERQLRSEKVKSIIPEDCMKPYFELFPKLQQQSKDDFIVLNKDTVIFFEPKDEKRHALRVHLIQSIGPVINKGADWQVLPVWLRTGKLVFFYRQFGAAAKRWIPVFQYGSSADSNPFTSETTCFKVPHYYRRTYADSAILEKTAVELFSLEAAVGLPASATISDWKVFFVLFSLRSDEKVNSEIKIELEKRSLTAYNMVLSKSALDSSVVVPMREEKGWMTSSVNQFNRFTAITWGTSRGIVKAGGSVDKFPNVLNVPLMDCLGHVMRIPCPVMFDRTTSVYMNAFNKFFGPVMESLKIKSMGQVVVFINADCDLGDITFNPQQLTIDLSTFDGGNVYKNKTFTTFIKLDEESVHKQSALGPIYPLYLYAEKVMLKNPVASDLLLCKAAHRLSILLATDEGEKQVNAQTEYLYEREPYYNARKALIEFVANARKVDKASITPADILYTFAEMCAGRDPLVADSQTIYHLYS